VHPELASGRAPSAHAKGAAGQRGSEAESGMRAEGATRPLDLEEILESVRETAYRWDFASDRIDWAANAETVLGIADMAELGKGARLRSAGGPRAGGRRYDGITGGPHVAPGTELRYCLHYRFLPEGRRGHAALWVEDTGVCSFDADSRPTKAQGTFQVIDDRREKEERLLYLGRNDELTGQLNRTRLTEEITQLLSSAGRARPKAPSSWPASTISPCSTKPTASMSATR
jgi:hypothetical protein